MDVKTEASRPSDVLLWEEDNFYSRATGTVAAGADLGIGTVLGVVTASGKYAPYDPDAVTGVETVAGVLLTPAAAADADVTDALIVVRHARVKRHGLVFADSVDSEAARDAACAGLEALGILTDV